MGAGGRNRNRAARSPSFLALHCSSTLITMVLVLDNYDSFTYNLVQYLGELGARSRSIATTRSPLRKLKRSSPSASCCHPAPVRRAKPASSSRSFAPWPARLPSWAFALDTRQLEKLLAAMWCAPSHLMHGKTSPVQHDGKGVFAGLPTPLTCTRYHSLIVQEDSLPRDLAVTARTEEHGGSVIMGLRHRTLPIEGVQFHPESVLTQGGHQMIRNFLEM